MSDQDQDNDITKSEPITIIYSRDESKPRGFFLLLFLFIILICITLYVYKILM